MTQIPDTLRFLRSGLIFSCGQDPFRLGHLPYPPPLPPTPCEKARISQAPELVSSNRNFSRIKVRPARNLLRQTTALCLRFLWLRCRSECRELREREGEEIGTFSARGGANADGFNRLSDAVLIGVLGTSSVASAVSPFLREILIVCRRSGRGERFVLHVTELINLM